MTSTMALIEPRQLWGVRTLHYASPAFVFFYFIITQAITVCTLQTQSPQVLDRGVRRRIILALILAAVGTYVAEVVVCIITYAQVADWHPGEDRLFYLIASTLAFVVEALSLKDTKFPVWYPYYGTWYIAIVAELTLLIARVTPPHLGSASEFAFIAIQSLRLSVFIVLPALYFGLRGNRKRFENGDAERQSLLRKKLASKLSGSYTVASGNGYGTATDTDTAAQDQDTANDSDAESEDSYIVEQREAQELITKRLKEGGSWFTYAKGFAIFFPYIWPLHSKALQSRAVLVAACLLASNALNVLIPRQMGVIVDNLSLYVKGDYTRNIWFPVIVYAALLFVNGGAGIGWLRKWLWLPLEQYSYAALSTASQAHMMSLSSDFHDSKTTSDLMQAITGGRSVTDLLETICFQIVPMFIDLTIAFAYLWSLFGPFMGLVLAATFFSYLYITTKLVAMRAAKRRQFIAVYRKEWTIGHQSLQEWNTASLFNMIPYERYRYEHAVKDHMKAKRIYELSSQSMNAAQGLTMTCGLLGALYLAVFQVAKEGKSIGQLTTFLVYWAQLQGPLVFFSSVYRNISYSLMDSERLLELFQTKPTIVDIPNAKPLKLGDGTITFDRVSFAYDDRKPTLKNVSFVVSSGKTIALVGETGGGKSTILKLIDRFYDVKSGSISIDGQDIRDVTLDSLRSKIGVVPQDPTLFNDTIMNNIRYARLDASDKEVYEACKAAAVHDKIMTFPDGYSSKVGDRGVRLSGGEKQRIAIARAILKCPDIILLDEATSAVDTETEHLIQEGLRELCRNRTTFIVAHRLSTVMRSDRILVVMDGEIVEEGSHHELVRAGGKYHGLWSKQILAELAELAGEPPHPPNPPNCDGPPDNATLSENATMPVKVSDISTDLEHKQTEDSRKSGSGHKREGSKLKPDAPEFVPLAISATSSSKPFSAPLRPLQRLETEPRKTAAIPSRQTATDNAEHATIADEYGRFNINVSLSPSAPAERNPVTSLKGTERPKIRSTRFFRRQIAKTEPANSKHEPIGGMPASSSSTIVPSERQPAPLLSSTQLRRVSAPSDFPKRPRARPRRSRYWRGTNRTGGGTNSSATNSGETSTYEITPGGAATSPAEVISSSTTDVTFAPGP